MRSTSLLACLFLLTTSFARADAVPEPGPSAPAETDAPPPSQVLATDPAPPVPRLGLSVDGIGIALADFALRVDWAPEPFHAFSLLVGESRRHGGDALLAAIGWTVFPMDDGLEGFFGGGSIGIAWAGPWNGADPAARTIGRLEAELGWQFLWADVSITLGAGVTGLYAPDQGSVWAEPHGRAALGIVLR